MSEIETEFLFAIALEVDVLNLGDTPYGRRRIARFRTGSFDGPKLKGTVLPGGGGWMLIRRDGALEIDVKITLETDDKQQVFMSWKGFRHGPKDVIDRLDRGDSVDPGDVLLPHHAILRDELGEVRLDEPYLLDRHRLAHGKQADLPGVSGLVGSPELPWAVQRRLSLEPHPQGETEARPGSRPGPLPITHSDEGSPSPGTSSRRRGATARRGAGP